MSKPKIEWVDAGAADNPAAYIVLDDERIGRVHHEGIGWVWYVRGTRRGGYANINQLLRDAVRHYRKLAAIGESK